MEQTINAEQSQAISFLNDLIKESAHKPTEFNQQLAKEIIISAQYVPGISLLNFRDGVICLVWAEQGVSCMLDDQVELYIATSAFGLPLIEKIIITKTEKVKGRIEQLLRTNKFTINS